MGTQAFPSAEPTTAVWADVIWPLLAGTAVAAGLIGMSHVYGVLGALGVYAALTLVGVVSVWSVAPEFEVTPALALRLGLDGSTVLLVMIGVGGMFGAWGLIAAAMIGLTAPPVLRLMAGRRPWRGAYRRARSATGG